jgi:hypothetical protein
MTIPDFPITSGTLRLSASLFDTSAPEPRFLDHKDTMLTVLPTRDDDRGLLRLGHRWEWE